MPWLMKAEPDSRVVKGKDVKFSVDDFEKLGVSQWDGVRNHEAKKIMKERMKLGDQVLFYHSNCKVPGVFAIAEIVKEGYPDYTAWDPDHPYFDPKTKQENPTWFMVDVKFIKRLPHPPTLALIKYIASAPSIPKEIDYIGEDGLGAIKGMQLVNRGRLSVQPVEQLAFDTIVELGTKGGRENLIDTKPKKSIPKSKSETITSSKPSSTPNQRSEITTKEAKPTSRKRGKAIVNEEKVEVKDESIEKPKEKMVAGKAKADRVVQEPTNGERRSKRLKK